MIRGALAFAAFALALGLSGGCDECEYGQVICHDNEVWSCTGTAAPLQWMRTSCGGRLCQVVAGKNGSPRGLCSVEAGPHPACADPVGPRGDACADGRVVTCDGGFVTAVHETCAAPELCFTAPVAFCAVSSTPDPRCAAAAVPAAAYALVPFCANGHFLRCAFPSQLLDEDTDCGGADLCYTPREPVSAFRPTCIVSRTPDARCAETALGSQTFSQICDEEPRQDTLLYCGDGLLISARDCGAAGCVHEPGEAYARCRGDTNAGPGSLPP